MVAPGYPDYGDSSTTIPGYYPTPTPTPRTPTPTREPTPTHTPRPTQTPRPTATPRPTQTPRPTATPKPDPTPKPESTPRESGPGARGGEITIRNAKPYGMDNNRWQTIKAIVYSPEVEAALTRQAAGAATADDRKTLNEANALMEAQIRRAEQGLPVVDPDPSAPTPEAPAVTATPTAAELGAPTPDQLPPSVAPPAPLAAPPVAGPPPEAGAPAGPPPPVGSDLAQPSDLLTFTDPDGNVQHMTRGEYNALDDAHKNALSYWPGSARAGAEDPDAPGARPTQVPPPPSLPAAVPNDLDTPGQRPEQIIPTPPAAAAAAPAAPNPTFVPSVTHLSPNRPDYQSQAATRAIEGAINPPQPAKPAAPAAAAKPAAPAAAAPKVTVPTPAPPPSIAPPPFMQDTTGAVLPENQLTRAIARAGGRPTQAVTSRVAGEIGDVFQPFDRGGWRGDTGGWRTLAQEAAAAWEQQYRDAPSTLDPAERAAYERDPNRGTPRSVLYTQILDPNSPFRNYRESWIGAVRAGQVVPDSQAFMGELSAYPGFEGYRPGGARPAPQPPGPIAAAQNVQPAGPPPVVGPAAAAVAADQPEVRTPAAVTIGTGVPPGVNPEDLTPEQRANLYDANGQPREYTPISTTIGTGLPPGQPSLQTAPEPAQVVPYAGQETPPAADGRIVPEATAAAPPVVVLAPPEDVPVGADEAPASRVPVTSGHPLWSPGEPWPSDGQADQTVQEDPNAYAYADDGQSQGDYQQEQPSYDDSQNYAYDDSQSSDSGDSGDSGAQYVDEGAYA